MPLLVNTTQVPTSEEPGDGTASHDDAGALGAPLLSHTREKSYTCTICGDSFKHKGILVTHQKSYKEEVGAEGCEKEGDADRAGELHDQEAIRAGGEANGEGHRKHSTQ